MQVTGDVLRVTTRIGAPTLPGFGPSAAAQAAAVAETARRGGAQAAQRRRLPQAAVEYLMPPHAPSAELASQVSALERPPSAAKRVPAKGCLNLQTHALAHQLGVNGRPRMLHSKSLPRPPRGRRAGLVPLPRRPRGAGIVFVGRRHDADRRPAGPRRAVAGHRRGAQRVWVVQAQKVLPAAQEHARLQRQVRWGFAPTGESGAQFCLVQLCGEGECSA